ncbi:MAG: wax ester/triacylglycerol synthase family O-acyltransferase [Halioglobus sp.]|nr:wax ester/triacylglycerol synthase family O-acyltransferase [Halioglobus sp.]MBP6723647.1 wax ester/triacylglycerol synthase family O-acyltransferase [Halioglobus sp.]
MQQFNPVDAALLFLESNHTPFHISTVTTYDPSTCPKGAPTFEDIKEAVRISLPVVETFRRRMVRVPLDLDYPYWIEDEDFDLDYHMRHLALPKPGNWMQFREQVSRLISRPLDLTRAPWEMTVIDGLDSIEGLPPGCFATVLKVHHCAIDGQTGVALINTIHQDSPKKKIRKVKDTWQPEEVPSNRALLRLAAVNGVRRPLKIARNVLANSRSLVSAAFNDIRSDDEEDYKAPDTLFNLPLSAHRTFDFILCPLDQVKSVRHLVEGATVNDVCLAMVAQGMRRYLAAKRALPEDSLITVVPVSTRTPDQAAGGGNQISITLVPLFTNIDDPIERLAAITAETRKKKAMQEGVVMNVMLDLVRDLPGALVGAVTRALPLIVTRAPTFCNTMVTNVPGPTAPIYFLGAKAVSMFGSPPLMDGGTLLHCVGSYNGDFIFSFTACRDALKDPDFYRECLEAGVGDVLEAAGKR